MKALLRPAFLQKADRYLLLHYPAIWATRAHYMAYYSLLLGNLGALTLGLVYPVSTSYVPGNIPALFVMTMLLAGGAYFSWVWRVSQVKQQVRSFGQAAAVFGIYIGVFLSLFANVLTFNGMIVARMATLVSEAQLEKDEWVFHQFGGREAYFADDYENQLMLNDWADRYGLQMTVNTHGSQYVDMEGRTVTDKSLLARITWRGDRKMEDALRSIHRAKDFTQGAGRWADDFMAVLALLAFFALPVGTALAINVSTGHVKYLLIGVAIVAGVAMLNGFLLAVFRLDHIMGDMIIGYALLYMIAGYAIAYLPNKFMQKASGLSRMALMAGAAGAPLVGLFGLIFCDELFGTRYIKSSLYLSAEFWVGFLLVLAFALTVGSTSLYAMSRQLKKPD